MRTRLSTKGQLIIPKAIRDRHGWSAGSELALEDRGDSIVIRSVGLSPKTTLEELVGCIGYRGPARSLEDMEAAIARGARQRRDKK
ncbi:MAG: AbrB/MazE/SpoVT family DNA-binding domain-containing protein [Acidobacteria bacterium]|nr:AbrB/MazE/SpoVT family DNA-binding domain-containing protein [Acidobacteriota bacterium]